MLFDGKGDYYRDYRDAKSIRRCHGHGISVYTPIELDKVASVVLATTSNGEYNGRFKVYHAPRILPSLQSINKKHYHSNTLLRRISEEFDFETTADEMTFVEHNDFQQGSTSSEPQQRPQNYGSGLGEASFLEVDDDDYEFLLDEGLARDGLYRGMSL